MIQAMVFWVVMLCSDMVEHQHFRGLHLDPEVGGSMIFQNVGILPCHYTASQPRRP